MVKWILAAVCAYLLGSLNFGVIISKLFYHQDLRTLGSGNAGATNALRVMGPKMALPVLLGDILKAVIACCIGKALAGKDGTVLAFLFVVLGHMYPVYFGFRGGKGVLAGATAFCMVDWRAFLVVFAVFLVLVLLTRYVSLGSVTAAVLMPLMLWLCHPDPLWHTLAALIVAALIVYRHRSNIGRLLHGTESKLSFHKKA